MTSKTNASHLKDQRFRTGVKVAGWSVVLIVSAYGIAEMPVLWSTLPNDVKGSAPSARTPAAIVQTGATAGGAAAQESSAVTSDEREGQIDDSRECLPEKSITAACIYE